MSKTTAMSKARRTVAGILAGAAVATGAVTSGFMIAAATESSTSSDADSATSTTSGGFTQTSTATSSDGSSQTSTHGS